jgi:hypothetical protein
MQPTYTPYTAPTMELDSRVVELPPTGDRVRAIWWLIMWRYLVGAVICGGIAGGLVGFFGAMAGYPVATLQPYFGPAGLLVGVAWGYVVVRSALRKTYQGFRLALVKA